MVLAYSRPTMATLFGRRDVLETRRESGHCWLQAAAEAAAGQLARAAEPASRAVRPDGRPARSAAADRRAQAAARSSATATSSRRGNSTSTASSPCRPISPGRARSTGRAPAVVFNHSHGGGYTIGKKEFVDGRSYLQPMPYAKALTDLGYIALAIDHWVFGERSHTTEGDMFKAMLWQGQVLWGMMVYDSLRAVDWLVGRADVDSARLATLGISMGSTMAWWLAALDERIKVTVDICCLTDFQTLLAQEEPLGARRLLLRAAPAEALHDRRDQRAHRAARAPRAGRPAGQADAGRRPRPHRPAS